MPTPVPDARAELAADLLVETLPLLVVVVTAVESFLALGCLVEDTEEDAPVPDTGPAEFANEEVEADADPNLVLPPGAPLIPSRPRFMILAGVTGTNGCC